jgi:hypothetical protein
VRKHTSMKARPETVPETGTDTERDKHEPGDARQVRSEARPNTTDKDNPDGAVAKHTESSPETKTRTAGATVRRDWEKFDTGHATLREQHPASTHEPRTTKACSNKGPQTKRHGKPTKNAIN